MAISIPVAGVLGAAVFLLCRYAGLKVWHAAACVILGFYLASTSLAPYISRLAESVIRNL